MSIWAVDASRRLKAVLPQLEHKAPPPEAGSTSPPAADPTLSVGGRRRAAGIYGTIVVAATLAAGGNFLRAWALAVSIVVTLLVYWLSEQYAEILGEHTHAGRLPTANQVRASLANTWPMVTASYVPVLVLIVAHLAGAATADAALIALIAAIVLLMAHGHAAGQAAGLRGARLLGVTGTAGLLGGAMVLLKTVVEATHH